MAGKKKTEPEQDANKIAPGELAVRITNEGGIQGGLGTHAEGAVLRNLSPSAFNTLTQGGLGEALAEDDDAADAVDASQPIVPTTGDGTTGDGTTGDGTGTGDQ